MNHEQELDEINQELIQVRSMLQERNRVLELIEAAETEIKVKASSYPSLHQRQKRVQFQLDRIEMRIAGEAVTKANVLDEETAEQLEIELAEILYEIETYDEQVAYLQKLMRGYEEKLEKLAFVDEELTELNVRQQAILTKLKLIPAEVVAMNDRLGDLRAHLWELDEAKKIGNYSGILNTNGMHRKN